MLSTKSSRLGVIGDLYLINWTEPLVWNGFISAPTNFCCQKLWMAAAIFLFQYWKWGRPYPDITKMTNWNQSVNKFEICFRFKNSEICRCPCVTQPWQATWKRFYNFSKTFMTSKLFNLLRYILITSKLITMICVFLTPTSSPQPPSPPPPIQFNLQVLIRLNMGEDVNQKHYPRLVLSETYLTKLKDKLLRRCHT